jgi:hypothetical protein
MPRRKKPTEESIRSANAILEEMSKSDNKARVMVIWPLFMVRFQATPEKREGESLYTLSAEGFDIHLAPAMSEAILFSSDGGLFLSHKGMAMTIELGEYETEELLARYPGLAI